MKSLSPVPFGFAHTFPLPWVCPVDVDDPRLVLTGLPYSLTVGPGGTLHFGCNLAAASVRAWRPAAWLWQGSCTTAVKLLAYCASPGVIDEGNPIIIPASGSEPRPVLEVARALPTRRLTMPALPDFTLSEPARPRWIPPAGESTQAGNIDAESPWTGGGLLSEHFPVVFNQETLEVRAAWLCARSVLKVTRCTPHVYRVGGECYAHFDAEIRVEVFAASSAEMDGGELSAVLLGEEWIFAALDQPSIEGGEAIFRTRRTSELESEAGQIGMAEQYSDAPRVEWGAAPLYTTSEEASAALEITAVQTWA